jgi:hypothetical protein
MLIFLSALLRDSAASAFVTKIKELKQHAALLMDGLCNAGGGKQR